MRVCPVSHCTVLCLTDDTADQLVGNTHLEAALRSLLPVPGVTPVVDLTLGQLSHRGQSPSSSPSKSQQSGQSMSSSSSTSPSSSCST